MIGRHSMLDRIPFNQPRALTSDITQTLCAHPLGGSKLETQVTDQMRLLLNIPTTTSLYLVQSATQALEVMALGLELSSGDEIIMPSYTYVATANAFAKTGAKIVFADIEPRTLNISPETIAPLISPKTKAIIPIHYGGMAADLEGIKSLISSSEIVLLEDAAHGVDSSYDRKPLGTLGVMGCISFHATKNIHAGGSGGLLLVNASKYDTIASETIFQGTNRKAFYEGKVSSYQWQRLGGAYEMSPYSLAFLNTALSEVKEVTAHRQALWMRYYEALKPLEVRGFLKLRHTGPANGHIFYMIIEKKAWRLGLQRHLAHQEIEAFTHYEPLHLSKAGQRYGAGNAHFPVTERVAHGLLRLPLYNTLSFDQQDRVIESIRAYFATL